MHIVDSDSARVRVPPPAVFAALGAAGWLAGLAWPLPFVRPGAEAPLGLLGGTLIGLGVVIAFWSIALFRRAGTSPIPVRPTTAIVEQGPYRWTRNPMYLGLTITTLGIGVAMDDVWIGIAALAAAGAIDRLAIAREERYLEAKFGPVYVEYKRRVRRWI